MPPIHSVDRLMDEADLAVVIGASPATVYHLSGFQSVAQRVIGEPVYCLYSDRSGGPYLVLPKREMDLIVASELDPKGMYPYGSTNIYRSESLSDVERRILELHRTGDFDDSIDALHAALTDIATGPRIGIEGRGINAVEYARIQDGSCQYEVVEVSRELQALRRTKHGREVATLRRSAEITEAAIDAAMQHLKPGMTELELAKKFRAEVSQAGATPLFVTVSFGERTAHTHPTPSRRPIEEGELIRWDAGCVYENYASDIGRTFGYGEGAREFEPIYDALYDGLQAALATVRPEVLTDEVYDACATTVRSAGIDWLSTFEPNHTGHGIGIEVYDPPTITPNGERIQEGMVLCVEPPYNRLGYGGFLIEDEIAVTADGYERFTAAPSKLPIVG